jgi:hypothetical protein
MFKFEFKESVRAELATTPHARLFHAILLQAMKDAIDGYGTERESAIRWLNEHDNVVKDICLILSGYDEHYIHDIIGKRNNGHS